MIFVPENFVVPKAFIAESYRLEILSTKFAELDYDAVMSSKARLRKVFGNATEWPKDNMSHEENMRDIKRHEQEFKSRKSFVYTVLNLSMEKCIGCVYIDPSSDLKYNCKVYLWVRDSYFGKSSKSGGKSLKTSQKVFTI
jgi:hypothetical protein